MNFWWASFIGLFSLIISSITGGAQSSPTSTLYTKIVHNNDPNARCLDGTSPPLYLHRGSEPQNILLYLMGGGSCAQGNLTQSLEACYLRSLTQFGSSTPWPATYSGVGLGVLETDPTKNKFANWTKIAIIYCDGALFQGNNVNPVPFNGKNLYFRGAVNMRSHISWANTQFNFNSAKKILLAGSSAGGFGVYLWIDYLKGLVSDPTKVYGVVDSGIFMDPVTMAEFGGQVATILPFQMPLTLPSQTIPNSGFSGSPSISSSSSSSGSSGSGLAASVSSNLGAAPILPTDSILQFMTVSNANQRPPNTNCLKSLNGTTSDWKCLFAGYASRYLQSKLLWIEAEYDQYIINYVLSLSCLSPRNSSGYTIKNCSTPNLLILDFYRSVIKMQIYTQLLATGHSLWSIACSWHVSIADSTIYNSPQQKAPSTGDRLTTQDAMVNFVLKNKLVNSVDQYPWPSNKNCAF